MDAFNKGDFVTAFKEWKPIAEEGNASAQFNLGFMYSNGWGVTQDAKEAVYWYKLAAEQKHASAQNNLANSYFYGEGTIQNLFMLICGKILLLRMDMNPQERS